MQESQTNFGDISAEVRSPLVDKVFKGKPLSYGADVTFESSQDLVAVLERFREPFRAFLKRHKVLTLHAKTPVVVTQEAISRFLTFPNVPVFVQNISIPMHVDEMTESGRTKCDRTALVEGQTQNYQLWGNRPLILGQNVCTVGRPQHTVAAPTAVAYEAHRNMHAGMIDLRDIRLPRPQIEQYFGKVMGVIASLGCHNYPDTPTGHLMTFKNLALREAIKAPGTLSAFLFESITEAVIRESLKYSVVMDWSSPENCNGALIAIDTGEPNETDKEMLHTRFNAGVPLNPNTTRVYQGTLAP